MSRGRWLPGFFACALTAAMAAAAIGVFPLPARAASGVPTDPDGFTAYVAKQFHKAIHHTRIKITGPLQLQIKPPPPADEHDVDLHTIFSFCLRNHDECRDGVATHVAQLAATYGTEGAPLERAAIRVVVRPSAYVDLIRKNQKEGGEPVAAHVAGDLWMVGAADLPTAIKMLTPGQLSGLKLSADEALALGRENMRASMQADLRHGMHNKQNDIFLLTGDPYEASLFAFPELWAATAHAVHDNLIVSVPAADVVLFGDGSRPGAEQAMRETAEDVMAHAERVFSAAVFRWSPGGWIEMPAPPAAR